MDADSPPSVDLRQLWHDMTEYARVGHPGSLSRGRSHIVRDHPVFEALADRDFVGVATMKTLQTALYPQSYSERPRLNRDGKRTVRRGPGPGKRYAPNRDRWQELVVIPFYRRPQEMCAWAYTDLDTLNVWPNPPDLYIPNAPECYNSNEYVSHPRLRFASLPGINHSRREAGLSMLSTALAPNSAFPGYVFATLYVEDAIRFQYRWLQEHWDTRGNLPLVGAFDNCYYRTAEAWDCIADRQIIFICEFITPPLLRQLIRCNGRVTRRAKMFNKMQSSVHERRFLPDDWIEHSLPWREYLTQVMFHLQPPEHYRKFAKILVKACLPPSELGELLLGSSQQWKALHQLTALPEFAPVIKSLQHLHGVHCPRPLQERIWGEQTYPWVTLRVEKKYLLGNGQVHWAGQVMDLQCQLYSFVVADAEVARGGLLKAVRRHIRTQQKQEPAFENRNWHFCDRELTQPHIEVIRHADRLGFVSTPEQWVFRLPQYGVRLGQIELGQKVPLVLPDYPAQGLEPPPPLSKDVLEPLREPTPQSALFWAIQQALYQLITAKCEFQSPLGVALPGRGADAVLAQIGRILDTPLLPAPGPRYWKHDLDQLMAKITAYDWPTVITSQGRSPRTISRLLAERIPRNCLLGIPPNLAVKAHHCGWLTLKLPESVSLPECWELPARQVLLNLLHQHRPGKFAKARKLPWQLRVGKLLCERLSPWGDFRPVLRLAEKSMHLPLTPT